VTRDFGGRYPKEWWAAHGFVVYVLQPSGATGYGQDFSALHVNTWGRDTIGEIIEGTKQFLAAHPFADPARVGCIGASYGGFTTMKLLTETDLFAAGVAHAGISALSSYWGEGYWGYLYSAVATADGYPWNRPDLYVEQSPLFEADKIRTPLLLTHGAEDTNVPPGESDQLFIALRLNGVPVEYLSVAGQNHWIVEHDKRVRWSRSIVAWFDRWLKDRPEWWNAMYPPEEGSGP
jgi:dipeptidyl aminopeptidase/acylaminoacyl peptidase